jgi:hypothetical protein
VPESRPVAEMRLLYLAAAVLAIAVSGSGGAAAAVAADPKQMVLRLADFPAGLRFKLDNAHYVDNATAAKSGGTPLATLKKWGRITGYQAEFLSNHIGFQYVRSSASAYKTFRGASDALNSYFREIRNAGTPSHPFNLVSLVDGLGDEARLYATTTESKSIGTIEIYIVSWRHGSVVAQMFGGGQQGGPSERDAVLLARWQEQRIKAAFR